MESVTAITNASTQVVWKSEYQPFGTTAGIQGTYEFDGGYTGKDVDDVTGLIYMWHRWQDPNTGSFISEDPIRDGNNWYSYCDGNPLIFIDSSGLKIIQINNANRMSNGEWADTQIGNGTVNDTKFQASGCLVTSLSQVLSALNGASVSPLDVNDANMDCFAKVSESDDGANFDQRILGKKNSEAGLIHNRWNRAVQGTEGLKGIIGEIKNSDKDFAIIGKFEFPHANGKLGSHYMPINGISEDGKFAIINPSSVNDDKIDPIYRDGWYVKDGKIYVPITKLQSIDTYRKQTAKEAWDKFWKGVGDALSGKKSEPEKKPAIEEEDNTTESGT